MSSFRYPDHLNPFDDDEGELVGNNYPDHLDPFGEPEDGVSGDPQSKSRSDAAEDYDDSLNPFGDNDDGCGNDNEYSQNLTPEQKSQLDKETIDSQSNLADGGNPFDEEEDNYVSEPVNRASDSLRFQDADRGTDIMKDDENRISPSPQPQSLESLLPPKPLPRTKSLLKKEQALKRLQQEQKNPHLSSTGEESSSHLATTSLNTIDRSSGSLTPGATANSFQRRKNKRIAPPVPINFKRQVTGSLEEIEAELNGIGDRLAIIEEESNNCQETLKAPDASSSSDFFPTRSRLIELIKEKIGRAHV